MTTANPLKAKSSWDALQNLSNFRLINSTYQIHHTDTVAKVGWNFFVNTAEFVISLRFLSNFKLANRTFFESKVIYFDDTKKEYQCYRGETPLYIRFAHVAILGLLVLGLNSSRSFLIKNTLVFLAFLKVGSCTKNAYQIWKYNNFNTLDHSYPNVQDSDGNTQMMREIIEAKGVDILVQRLNQGFELEVKNHKGQTPLLLAARFCPRFVPIILKGLVGKGSSYKKRVVNAQDEDGYNVLMTAVIYQKDIVQDILKLNQANQLGLDRAQLSNSGKTAVELAETYCPKLKAYVGADQYNSVAVDSEKNTRLHILAASGEIDVIEEEGFEAINQQNGLGDTPLMVAMKANKVQVVQWMLLNGSPNLGIQNEYGYDALMLAFDLNLENLPALILTFKPPLNNVTNKGNNILMLCVLRFLPGFIEKILQQNRDYKLSFGPENHSEGVYGIDAQNNDGDTALNLCARYNPSEFGDLRDFHYTSVNGRATEKKFGNLNKQNNEGFSPFLTLARFNPKYVASTIEASQRNQGQDIDHKKTTNKNCNALDLSACVGSHEAVAALIKTGKYRRSDYSNCLEKIPAISTNDVSGEYSRPHGLKPEFDKVVLALLVEIVGTNENKEQILKDESRLVPIEFVCKWCADKKVIKEVHRIFSTITPDLMDVASESGNSALMLAILYNPDLVPTVIDFPMDWTKRNEYGETYLTLALKHCPQHHVKIHKKCPDLINMQGALEEPPILVTIRYYHIHSQCQKAFEYFLEQDAELCVESSRVIPNSNNTKLTPIVAASIVWPELIATMVEKNPEVLTFHSPEQPSPLEHAIYAGLKRAVYLIGTLRRQKNQEAYSKIASEATNAYDKSSNKKITYYEKSVRMQSSTSEQSLKSPKKGPPPSPSKKETSTNERKLCEHQKTYNLVKEQYIEKTGGIMGASKAKTTEPTTFINPTLKPPTTTEFVYMHDELFEAPY